ncbi:MAG: molybdenum cofactor guanylyltransferase [Anaerolineales bacterium]|nr:molybdenum cofactor guanylyltransferase [Anaerolineales bacterium]
MLTISVQAGGKSNRMGREKARMLFLGRPLLERIVERLAPIAVEVLVTVARPEDCSAFPDLRCVPDLLPGFGPLGGLYTALSAASQPLVGLVACDMPFASPALLARACDLLLGGQYDAVVPISRSGREPLHAVYRRQTCLPLVHLALETGERKLDSWFSQAEVYFLTPDEIARSDPGGRAFWNLNTLEEFRQAEELAREEEDPHARK